MTTLEIPKTAQNLEHAPAALHEWITDYGEQYSKRQRLSRPAALDITPLASLVQRRPHLFNEATVASYLGSMRLVEAIETGSVEDSDLTWVVLHGAIDAQHLEGVGDEQPYAIIALSERMAVEAAIRQIAIAPMGFDEDVGLWVPQEQLLVDTSTDRLDWKDQQTVLALAQAVLEVLPEHKT